MLKLVYLPLLICFLFACTIVRAQDTSRVDRILNFPDKIFSSLEKRTTSFNKKLDEQTNRYLARMERQELRLKRKMCKKDSVMARQVFGNVTERYAALRNTKGATGISSVYSGHLDSLNTALSFINAQNLNNSPEVKQAMGQLGQLQNSFNASEQIRKQLEERQKLLQAQFQKLGMVKAVKQYQKQVYYYRAQINEYKSLWEQPSKLEEKLIGWVVKMPKFKSFFADNSILGSMFSLPGRSNAAASLQGLQTVASVNQVLTQQFGSGPDVTQQLRQNLQEAQGQLSQLKQKIAQYQNGSYDNSADADMPGFKPNTQKTKSFFKRLEYGANIQTQKARYYFPVTSDLGLSLGYKINDKSSIGIGAAYRLGWGRGWDNINITHQGIGLRSYLDWKIKGSFYASGGYEMNYQSLFKTIDQLKNYQGWQESGLIGVSKKYKVSKKVKGEVKIMWDFLSYQQMPRTQPVLFRVGYCLK